MSKLLQDVRYALRQLRKNPGFTFMAVLTLALGIGATTAIFSLMNAVMLRMLPVHKPEELVLFGSGGPMGVENVFPNAATDLFSYPFYRDFQQKNQVFSGVAAMQSLPNDIYATVGSATETEPLSARLVSGTYFSVLGVNPVVGRVFTDADDQGAGAHPVAVLSYGVWDRRFQRDRSIVGQHLTVGSTVFTIIGVAPPGFFGTIVGESPDLWIPLSMETQVPPGWNGLDDKMFQSLYVFGRLKPGVSAAQAGANTNVVFKQILHDFAGPAPDQGRLADIQHAQIILTPAATGLSRLRFRVSMPLRILMAVVVLVLLIACANIANLLLAHGTSRGREIAVRMAVGAGRARLIRQLLSESLLLSFVGGLLGVAFAWWASQFLLRMVAAGLGPISLDVGLDRYVLGFTVAVSVATAVVFGLLPAFRATRVELVSSLKEARGSTQAGGRSRLARILVVGQVALSLVLLAGAGLFLRTLVNLSNVDAGFDPHGAMVVHLDPSATGLKPRSPQATSLYQQVEQRVDAIPGVSKSSFCLFSFGEGGWRTYVFSAGFAPRSESDRSIHGNIVGPDFFAAMGTPVINGRTLGAQDTASSPRVAVINRAMALRLFPNESAIGKHFGIGGNDHSNDVEVVGVVEDAKLESLDEELSPAAYFPYSQFADYGAGPGYLFELVVRYSGNAESLGGEVRQAIAEVNRSLPIAGINTLSEQVDHSMVPQSLIAQLSSFFGLLAVFLASIGLYGLMAYAVNKRTSEIGVRMALGARQSSVRWMVLREALLLVALGILIGVPAALAADRLLSSLLFGLSPTDPLNLLTAVVFTFAIAAFASYIPARRAMNVDPIVALRYE
jgi:predicted permease